MHCMMHPSQLPLPAIDSLNHSQGRGPRTSLVDWPDLASKKSSVQNFLPHVGLEPGTNGSDGKSANPYTTPTLESSYTFSNLHSSQIYDVKSDQS